jgi:tetratricopeptide (TPR) repeat protein
MRTVKRSTLMRVPFLLSLLLLAATTLRAEEPGPPSGKAGHGNADKEKPEGDRPLNAKGRIAPLFKNLGTLHHEVTTESKEAAAYCDQGLRWYYGFNFAEALRAYEQAAAIDPQCAMAWWGQAIVLGPSINHAMDPADVPKAMAAIGKALELAGGDSKLSESEKDYITALAARYSDDPQADRAGLDLAYANAMRKVAKKYPDDPDAGTLFAAAMMNLRPWDYWARDGHPHEGTEELVAELERVIAYAPDHPGALHYYIHAVEASNEPERALDEADRLRDLVPGAGHLVHMPSHIYIRTGHYGKASQVNRLALEADSNYEDACRGQGFFALGYHPHNIHFLASTSMIEGNYENALEAARFATSKVPQDKLSMPPMGLLHQLLVLPLQVQVRFGRWDEILAMSPPSENDSLHYRAVWHYAKGMALARGEEHEKAARELKRLKAIAADDSLAEFKVFDGNNLQSILNVAVASLAGELASARGEHRKAIAHLERAVRLEDALLYDEPPPWPLTSRQYLGAALLKADRPAEAEQVYWEDLRRLKENGWSLFGIVQALEAQGNQAAADEVRARFKKAWSNADTPLKASRF